MCARACVCVCRSIFNPSPRYTKLDTVIQVWTSQPTPTPHIVIITLCAHMWCFTNFQEYVILSGATMLLGIVEK